MSLARSIILCILTSVQLKLVEEEAIHTQNHVLSTISDTESRIQYNVSQILS